MISISVFRIDYWLGDTTSRLFNEAFLLVTFMDFRRYHVRRVELSAFLHLISDHYYFVIYFIRSWSLSSLDYCLTERIIILVDRHSDGLVSGFELRALRVFHELCWKSWIFVRMMQQRRLLSLLLSAVGHFAFALDRLSLGRERWA